MADPLQESKTLLVRRWGELGGYWGISRTMAEIHALLFVAGRPLCTDDIMQQLHVSRGNASMNLRGLVDWGLVHRVHKLGDRKEYFQADADVWHMFETITRERRRREVEPIVTTIDRCRAMVADADHAEARDFCRRLGELHDFLTTMGRLFELVLRFGNSGVVKFAKLLDTSLAASLGTTQTRRKRKAKARKPAGAKAKR